MIVLPSARARLASVPFLFRAHACLDDFGLYALSYGQRVYATFTRSGRATLVDQRGQLLPVPQGMPRISHLPLSGSRVPALLLERAVTNLVPYSQDFDSWTSGGATVSANVARAPDGTTTMDRLASASSGSDSRYQGVAFTGNGTKAFGVWYRPDTATESRFGLYDVTAGVFRHEVRISVSGGEPTLSTASGAGALRTPVYHADSGAWWCEANATGVVAANTNRVYVYPDLSGATLRAYFWGAQASDAVVVGSHVATGAAADTQQAESLSWPFLLLPAALSAYYNGIEIGLRESAGAAGESFHCWAITNSTADAPRLALQCFTSTMRYQVQRTLASSAQATAAINSDAAQPAVGEGFEAVGYLSAGGVLTSALKRASAAAMTTAASGTVEPLDAAWASPTRLYLNQNGSGIQKFRSATRALCFAPGALSMDALRDLCELG